MAFSPAITTNFGAIRRVKDCREPTSVPSRAPLGEVCALDSQELLPLLFNPDLDSAVLFATRLGVVGGHGKIRTKALDDSKVEALLLELQFDGMRSTFRDRLVGVRCTSAV